jgi:hypothetical protein
MYIQIGTARLAAYFDIEDIRVKVTYDIEVMHWIERAVKTIVAGNARMRSLLRHVLSVPRPNHPKLVHR